MRNLVPDQRLRRITLKLGECTKFKALFVVVSGILANFSSTQIC